MKGIKEKMRKDNRNRRPARVSKPLLKASGGKSFDQKSLLWPKPRRYPPDLKKKLTVKRTYLI
jgi:hypothetical protein